MIPMGMVLGIYAMIVQMVMVMVIIQMLIVMMAMLQFTQEHLKFQMMELTRIVMIMTQ